MGSALRAQVRFLLIEFLNFLLRKGWLVILFGGLAFTVFSGQPPASQLFVASVWSTLIVAAAVFTFWRGRRSQRGVSRRISLLRSSGELIPFAKIDKSRPLIGIVSSGSIRGAYVWITFAKESENWIASLLISRA